MNLNSSPLRGEELAKTFQGMPPTCLKSTRSEDKPVLQQLLHFLWYVQHVEYVLRVNYGTISVYILYRITWSSPLHRYSYTVFMFVVLVFFSLPSGAVIAQLRPPFGEHPHTRDAIGMWRFHRARSDAAIYWGNVRVLTEQVVNKLHSRNAIHIY